jgi:serine/alanine adding enzyme
MYDYTLLQQVTPDDERMIYAFIDANPGFQFFQSPVFYQLSLTSKKLRPFYIIAKQEGSIVGVLLACRQVQINLPFIRFLTSRNLIIGGPLVRNQDEQIVNGLLATYRIKSPRSLYTQVRNMRDTTGSRAAFLANGFGYEDHLTILVDLGQTEEELWKDVHSKRRNEIRRAEKEGCRVEMVATLETLTHCYDILTEVYHRAKLPLPDFSHFKAMLQHSTETIGLRIFTAVWKNRIIGCMLCIAWGDTLYDYYAGSYSRYYNKYPNDLLPWAVFKWAKMNGFSRFDFGGAGKPNVPYGVRDYKKKFGGALVSFGRYECVHFPILFRLMTQLFIWWQRAKR